MASLTEREREVLQLVADGLTNKSISERLHITVKAVEFHLQNIKYKLVADTKANAVAEGIRSKEIA